MAFAILRTAKLKTAGNIGALGQHLERTRETPNADRELREYNSRPIGSENLHQDVQARLQAAGIEKPRKNAVLAIEHLMTASPEFFNYEKKISPEGKVQLVGQVERWKAFEKASIAWLQKRYGPKNVVNVTVHKDEQAPHIHAVVVPIDGKGKLNCRSYLGGREKLREMQTSFADQLAPQGLERGIPGSRAHHQEVKQFYGQIRETRTPEWDVALEKPQIQIEAPRPTLFGYQIDPSVQAQRETERINSYLSSVNKANQEKAHRRLIELHQAAQGVSLLKRQNNQLQGTLGALNKANAHLKENLQGAGLLLTKVAQGDIHPQQLKKALEQTPQKGHELEQAIWEIMKSAGVQVKEVDQERSQQQRKGRGMGL